jgi:hypothetical protein
VASECPYGMIYRNLAAKNREAFTIDAFVSATHTVLAQLRGAAVPDLQTVVGPTYEEGRPVVLGSTIPAGAELTLGRVDHSVNESCSKVGVQLL